MKSITKADEKVEHSLVVVRKEDMGGEKEAAVVEPQSSGVTKVDQMLEEEEEDLSFDPSAPVRDSFKEL